jgi:predicted membrane-bound spermidine synthase
MTGARPASNQGALLLASLAFLISGAAALVYQVSWQRLLALSSGVGIYSVAMIVASFMAGLGLGSRLGGSWSARVTPRRALALFCALELLIGLFGAASTPIFYDLLYLRGGWLYGEPWRAGLVHFGSLLIPTTLMGMSLPLLVRGMVRSSAGASRTIGILYGVNALGAALGAAATPWLLVRHWGIPGAIWTAAAANLAAALIAVALAARAQGLPSGAQGPGAVAPETPGAHHAFGLWLALYGLGGFIALGLEILWFRIVDVAVKSTAFTFGTVLALYLVGYGAGSLLGARLSQRLAHPLGTYCLMQAAMLVVSGLAVILLVAAPADAAPLAWYLDYWRRADGFKLGAERDWAALARLYLVIPGLLYGVPTLLMGLSFPILQRAVQDDPATSGRKVGYLQAANIAGCVAGSLVVGLVALDRLGTMDALRGLLALGLVFTAVDWWSGARARPVLVGAVLAAVVVALPANTTLWARLHGVTEPAAAAGLPIGEDATAVVALAPRGEERRAMLVGGHGHSWIPYGGVHTRLGALPLLVHPSPLDVAIVGLGSGDTARAAGCRPETRSVTVFEIARPQLRLLAQLVAAHPDLQPSPLGRLLADERVEVRYADGRAALRHDTRLYDVIETDALKPHWGMSGNLYSEEFFALCARRLKPGGLMCTWVPSIRTLRAFRRVFPHALRLDRDGTFIGSTSPIPLDSRAWAERARTEHVVAHFGAAMAGSLERAVAELRPARQRAGPGAANSDLFPRDEFMTPEERP